MGARAASDSLLPPVAPEDRVSASVETFFDFCDKSVRTTTRAACVQWATAARAHALAVVAPGRGFFLASLFGSTLSDQRGARRQQGKKCLVLDLDETLVHSSFKPVANADFIIPVEIEDQVYQVYVLKRPRVDDFMKAVGEKFEVVIFTASLSKYADPVIDLLDKHRVCKYVARARSLLVASKRILTLFSSLGTGCFERPARATRAITSRTCDVWGAI